MLFARERVDVVADPELPADARDELGRAERLADEIVRAHLEGAGDLLVRVERGQHDDGDVLRPRASRTALRTT